MSSTALDIAQALVRIPSVNPNYDPASAGEGAVTQWIEDWGRAHGFTVCRQPVLPGRENVLLQFRNGADHPHFMLNGHTDTVGVGGMTIPPFGGEVREGRLWGRGASDMKGPLACMMAAALCLKNAPSTWRGTLTVACMADEEFRFRGVTAMLEQMAGLPDFAVVGEPTRLRVVRGCKGCLRFAIHALGRAAHSSKPHEGRSAVVAMAHAILELERHFTTRLTQIAAPGFGTSTGSIGLISGGTGVNIVPERCAIKWTSVCCPARTGARLTLRFKPSSESVAAQCRTCSGSSMNPASWTPASSFPPTIRSCRPRAACSASPRPTWSSSPATPARSPRVACP